MGIACFVVKNTLSAHAISLNDVYVGSYPFLIVMFLTLLVLVFFPGLVTAVI